jgi:ATP-dependent helicase Lhr and Lhr-like helicase
MPAVANPLALFDGRVAAWFRATYGAPTEAQALAWPRIAAGEHVLVSAPTGTGKTLAAFLWAVERLLTGAWEGGVIRVLYVSPLKALNADVRRNLLGPLEGLRAAWLDSGETPPEVRVMTRSGDTPQDERQRMARRPPEILITTPESLNILLTSRRGRAVLAHLATVILDEIHAVVSTKRGVHLMTAVERLVPLAGEVQRIALSATVTPLDRVASWVGGYEKRGEGETATYRPRRVATVASTAPKRVELSVCFPAAALDPEAADASSSEELWRAVAREVAAPVRRNRSTLVFANSRRMVEKLTRLVNEEARDELVYSHHGSLSRELRTVVEERLKAGQLKGIVATNSLELGIDVGALDEVVLVQAPPTVASAVQRIGRAGHAVGAVSRGRFVPLVPADLLAAAVVARSALDGAIEPARPVAGALDVLAQVIVSMCCSQAWPIDELFAELRRSDAYHDLPRRGFDLTLEMLAGRYATSRVRDVRPLLSIDRVDGTVVARAGADRTVYMAGGTIPDRGVYHLRISDSAARLGELDEEFVWERSVGDTFALGAQSWRIERITHNDVFVRPARTRSAMAPFWRAEERNRSFELSERIGTFLERADAALGDPSFAAALEREHALDPAAAGALMAYLARQKAATGGRLPHRHRVIVERVSDPQGRGEGAPQIVVHTVWGGRVNRPLALALMAAWEERHGPPLEVMHDDDCLIIAGDTEVDPDELFGLVCSDALEALLRRRLERSGFFGARFREAAGRALLLPREGFLRRTPLWLSRQRAKELLAAVSRHDDFPIVLEAWRSCLVDEFDLDAARRVLDEIAEGRIEVAVVRTDQPSPFAAHVMWKRTNELMYEDDAPAGRTPSVRPDLVRELVYASHLRPRLPAALAAELAAKLQRTHPGYAPRDARELLDILVERVVIPSDEWMELLAACARDHGADTGAWLAGIVEKAVALTPQGSPTPACVVAVENLPRVVAAADLDPAAVFLGGAGLDGSAPPEAAERALRRPRRPGSAGEGDADGLAELLADVLRSYGPVATGPLGRLLGVDAEREATALSVLVDAGRVVVDELTVGAGGPELCDAENLARLLRTARSAARPAFTALSAARLPLFLAVWQGLDLRPANPPDLRPALERLLGWPAPAAAWETELLPARLESYAPARLDALLADTDLVWLGCGDRRVTFVLGPDRDLVAEPRRHERDAGLLLPHPSGRFGLEEIVAHAAEPSARVVERLWRMAWRGEVSTDSFEPVRRAAAAGFRIAPPPTRPAARRAPRRLRFDRWQTGRPFAGRWFALAPVEPPGDALDAEELARERARLLLDRYGVVFRALLARELPPLRWGVVFRALRLMELSGEIVTGQFFAGVEGLQFATPAALRLLRDGLPEDRAWWLNATDPASPCGLEIEGLPAGLPRRLQSNHVAFRGQRPIVIGERRGRRLSIGVAPDDADLPDLLGFLRSTLGRSVGAERAIVVETINGEPAASSPYRPALESLCHAVRDRSTLRLSRKL